MNINLNVRKLDTKFQKSLELIAKHLDVSTSNDGLKIETFLQGEGIEIVNKNDVIAINIANEKYFIRAIGLLVEKLKAGDKDINIKEKPSYESLEVMLDCSRNAVINFESYKDFVINIALMGYNTIQLYMEDTYEVKEYPYFGYLRGKYSKEELQKMDTFADRLFVEVVPAIQTLAHLRNTLKWDAFEDMHDLDDILLVGEEKTYELIDAMFKNLSESIKSRNINIGMDEAHMLGLGKYLDKHGYQDRFDIMLTHLNKVMEIARKYDYKPIMWSDMFFRLGSGGEYYDTDWEMRDDIKENIPEDVSLVYWDYFSENQETYDNMIAKHREMSDNIVFAGGAWKWKGFSPNNLFSHKIAKSAHRSCMKNNIEKVIVTAWGDNGAEASHFSILPSLQVWAELTYTNNDEESYLANRFKTCTKGDYKEFLKLDMPMLTPNNPAPGKVGVNPPKYILYQDILSGMFDLNIDKATYPLHFQKSSKQFEDIISEGPSKWNYIFETQKDLCDVLAIKSHCGINIRAAYKNDNKETLEDYSDIILPGLVKKTEVFIKTYRKQWLKENKTVGLEVFDIRMGGLVQRIKTVQHLLREYTNGRITQIDELEEDLLYYSSKKDKQTGVDLAGPFWHEIATVSNIDFI